MTDMATHDPGDNPAVPAVNVPINASCAVKIQNFIYLPVITLSAVDNTKL